VTRAFERARAELHLAPAAAGCGDPGRGGCAGLEPRGDECEHTGRRGTGSVNRSYTGATMVRNCRMLPAECVFLAARNLGVTVPTGAGPLSADEAGVDRERSSDTATLRIARVVPTLLLPGAVSAGGVSRYQRGIGFVSGPVLANMEGTIPPLKTRSRQCKPCRCAERTGRTR